MYRKDAQIVLIDSSLSTLDSRVSSKVLKRAINKLCQDKLVFFVTHDLNHAAQMDHVIYMQDKGKQSLVLNAEEFAQQYDMLRGQLSSSLSVSSNSSDASSDNQGDVPLLGIQANDKEEGAEQNVEDHQLIEEEKMIEGTIGWADVKEYFSYAAGGVWGMALVFFLHLLINCATMGVSLFLAFELTQRFSDEAG